MNILEKVNKLSDMKIQGDERVELRKDIEEYFNSEAHPEELLALIIELDIVYQLKTEYSKNVIRYLRSTMIKSFISRFDSIDASIGYIHHLMNHNKLFMEEINRLAEYVIDNRDTIIFYIKLLISEISTDTVPKYNFIDIRGYSTRESIDGDYSRYMS